MKALVITNCATAAYTSGLRALFPAWEVKGANLEVAQRWLDAEPNEAFRTFLNESNLLLLGSENEAEFAAFAQGKDVLSIPYFYFRAFHPDAFHLGIGNGTVPSVLQTGNLHSRIAVAGFVLGLSQEQTRAAFNGEIYTRLGYLSLLEPERENLFERFAAKHIDLAQPFARWYESGNFLYTHNHARAFVFNDILLDALCPLFIAESQRENARATLAAVPDYLEPSIRWPVYPEIARLHSIETDFLWRTGVNAGPVSMTCAEFVARTFDALRGFPELKGDCIPGFDLCRAALVE